jgi:hypothetical protein
VCVAAQDRKYFHFFFTQACALVALNHRLSTINFFAHAFTHIGGQTVSVAAQTGRNCEKQKPRMHTNEHEFMLSPV